MSIIANIVGFSRKKAYMLKQSGALNRATDCRALNPSSQEN
jgi:hypothetical protein